MQSRRGIAVILLILCGLTPCERIGDGLIPEAFALSEDTGSGLRIDGALLRQVEFKDENRKAISGIYRDTASKSPQKPRVRLNFGAALMEQGDYDGALREYGATLQLSFRGDVGAGDRRTARLKAQTNIAQILFLTGRHPQAEQFLLEAWEETPGFPSFAVPLSIYAITGGRLKEARAILDDGIAALAAYPSADSFVGGQLYFNRAAVKNLEGDCGGAEQDYQKSRRYPDIPELEICPTPTKEKS